MNKKRLIFLLLAMIPLLVLAGLPSEGQGSPNNSHMADLQDTTICGSFLQPVILGGIPTGIHQSGIYFQDGYFLSLIEIPSVYLNKYGVFHIQSGKAVEYGIAADPPKDLCSMLAKE